MPCARAARLRRPMSPRPSPSWSRPRPRASQSPPSPPMRRACARWRTPPAPPTERSSWSAAPWSASCRSRARRAISKACATSSRWKPIPICRRTRSWRLCTGSQGEPRAALARIAEDQHPEIKFSRGDRVIYSARTIPGNEKAVGRVINGLIEQGIEVITDRTHLVHVSGHPRRAELEELIGWVKPQIVIPVHGEALHLTEHAALARRCGVKQVIQCRNGDLVRLSLRRADHRRGAGRTRLQGRHAAGRGRRPHGRRPPAPDVCGHDFDRIGADRRWATGRRSELRPDRHSRARPRRRFHARGRARRHRRNLRTRCRVAAAAIPTRSPRPFAAPCARPSSQRWGKKPMCHVHVLAV